MERQCVIIQGGWPLPGVIDAVGDVGEQVLMPGIAGVDGDHWRLVVDVVGRQRVNWETQLVGAVILCVGALVELDTRRVGSEHGGIRMFLFPVCPGQDSARYHRQGGTLLRRRAGDRAELKLAPQALIGVIRPAVVHQQVRVKQQAADAELKRVARDTLRAIFRFFDDL